jgi:hypothetical protein
MARQFVGMKTRKIKKMKLRIFIFKKDPLGIVIKHKP